MDQNNNLTSGLGVQYAGFWIRFAAAIIDGIILAIPNYIIQLVFHRGFIAAVLMVVINVAYYAYLGELEKQATIGKMIVGVRVTDLYGNRIDLTKAIIRSVSKYASAIILFLGYIMVAFTSKNKHCTI